MLKSVSWGDQERDDHHLDCDDHDQGLCPETLLAPLSQLLPDPLNLQQEVHHHHDDHEDDLEDNYDDNEDNYDVYDEDENGHSDKKYLNKLCSTVR